MQLAVSSCEACPENRSPAEPRTGVAAGRCMAAGVLCHWIRATGRPLTCGGSDWVAMPLSWTVASLPVDLSHLRCVRCPEVTGSGPDLRGNRISYGVAVAAASGVICRAWVLLTCGSPLADGLVTGHGPSSEVADSREQAPPGPGCGCVG